MSVFTWRCLHDILPTRANLLRRGIVLDPVCARCGRDAETIEHIFRDCNWSFLFWRASPLRINLPLDNLSVNFQDWFLFTIKDKPPDFIDLFVGLLWSIWHSRNLLIFQGKSLSHMDCFQIAQAVRLDYQEANRPGLFSIDGAPVDKRWNPPPSGWIKLNLDASCAADGTTGLGGAFRGFGGQLLELVAHHIPCCEEIEVAESCTCLLGIRRAKEVDFRDLIVEMDHQGLVFALQKEIIPRSPAGTVIADILNLAKEFDRVTFHWIGRRHNRVAHHIASIARNPFFCFDVNNPSFVSLQRLVSADLAPYQ